MKTHRPGVIRLAIAGILWIFLGRMGGADQWGPPRTEHRSRNRQYTLNVAWPESKKLTLLRATPEGGKKELWSRPYVDETFPPHMAYVADDGQHVVLRDVYHNLGDGEVLVFLGPKGNVLRSYELADLLTQDQILACRRTVSSLWWSEPGWFALSNGDKEFTFATHFGAVQCFDVATGQRTVLDEKKHAEVRGRVLSDVLPLLKSKSPYRKADAAVLCGALKATEAVPELNKLLGDRTPTSWQASGLLGVLLGGSDYSGVQVAAAEALISILKTKAVPLIEEQLADATPATREDLLHAIASLDGGLFMATNTPDSTLLLATWHRLSQSQLADVRRFAVQAILARDQAQYVYDHPELLKDPYHMVRYHAVRCLVERGDKRAVALLKTALQDSYSPTQTWAFRGIVKYQPDDVLDVLRRGVAHEDRTVRLESLMELVRRGDKAAIAAFISRIAALKNHTDDREGWGTEEMEAREMCELAVNLKLSAAEPALRQASTNKCERIRRPVCGALAALGDQDALRELRKFTRVGDALDRASSIRMLSLVGDTASIPALREALGNREPWVREAAKEAIARLEKMATGTRSTGPGGKN